VDDGKEELIAKKELKGSPYKYYVKEAVTSELDMEINWLLEKIPQNATLGIDPQTFTASQVDSLRRS